ncbi:hypothetical protein ABFS82_05G131800 [Erythranthe guttata]|uniref:Uncharacterized protein n=1 Tax=Erythranthe guttata TaxID=4155 RepID=A0A022QKN2_ERYGU|nr:hypothetical protein MIMGU_mgv1a023867mg [Erythranthe guttata]
MGLLSWFYGSKQQKKENTAARKPHDSSEAPAKENTAARKPHEPYEETDDENTAARESHESSEASEMNGAVEVRRHNPPPIDVTVLEIGTADKEVLAGYCPVSNVIEPCTWKVLPAREDSAKIRIVF